VRLGRSGLDGTIAPAAALNPMNFGIRNGVERPVGLPQMVVAGGLNFGGPANFPQVAVMRRMSSPTRSAM
jgi:hypothetical protein